MKNKTTITQKDTVPTEIIRPPTIRFDGSDDSIEYDFETAFSIKCRTVPEGLMYAMGEAHTDINHIVYDLYEKGELLGTYDTFEKAKEAGSWVAYFDLPFTPLKDIYPLPSFNGASFHKLES